MTLLKFTASWCAPCRTMASVMRGMDYVDVDVDSDEPIIGLATGNGLALEYSVRSVPTLVLVNDDMSEVSRLVGLKSREQIEAWLSGPRQ